jgi:hypothetical protein
MTFCFLLCAKNKLKSLTTAKGRISFCTKLSGSKSLSRKIYIAEYLTFKQIENPVNKLLGSSLSFKLNTRMKSGLINAAADLITSVYRHLSLKLCSSHSTYGYVLMTSQLCLEEKKSLRKYTRNGVRVLMMMKWASVSNKGNSYSILCFILVCPCFNSVQVPRIEEESFYRGKG